LAGFGTASNDWSVMMSCSLVSKANAAEFTLVR
jgi:hypothetical protein